MEEIMDKRTIKKGRGKKTELLVKWRGYARPSWEPYDALDNTIALDEYERRQEEKGGDVIG